MGLPTGLNDRLSSLRRRVKASPAFNDDASIYSQPPAHWYKLDLRRNTRARRIFALSAAGAYFLSWIFLILIQIGSTNKGSVIGEIYFYRISLANIIPESVENAELINSIARGIGLHDFYQPGLWSFCEGYDDEGITYCSKPEAYYWFNIVQIILDELLSGATIALPSTLTTIINILKICSHIMFALFLAGTIMAFLMAFLSPLAIFSRWWSLPMAFISSLTFVCILAASVIASVISFIFKFAATAQSTLNIHAAVGYRMFAFMWIATGFALIGFILHAGMGCCCASRRDLQTGRKPMRHSSMKRAMSQRTASRAGSQRSQMSQMSSARNVSMVAGGGRSRSNTAFSFEEPTAGARNRSGTLSSMHNNLQQISEEEGGVGSEKIGSEKVSRSNSGVSRSNTLRDKSGQVTRSNTQKSTTAGAGGRARSNTAKSIRFEDEGHSRTPSYESDTTAVGSTDGAMAREPPALVLRNRHSTLPEEE